MTLYLEKNWSVSSKPVAVYDEYQQAVCLVEADGVSLRQRVIIRDNEGEIELAKVVQGLSLFKSRKILYYNTKRIATVRQRLTSRNRRIYDVSGLKWRIKEDVGQQNFQLTDREGQLVAEVTKCWMFRAERFALTIYIENIDPIIVLAAFLAVDLSAAKNELYQVVWDAPYSME